MNATTRPQIEYVIWGIAPGATEEEVLFSRNPITLIGPIVDRAFVDKLVAIAHERGATSVRVQTVDMTVPPSFR